MSKVYAITDGFVGFGGRSVPLNAGDVYDSDDAIVKALPEHFTPAEPVPVKVSRAVKR